MTEKLLVKLKEAKRLGDLSSTYNDESERLKEEVWDVLGSRYSLVLDRVERDKFSWHSRDFDDELQLLLRSMIRRNKVVYVPDRSLRNFPKNFNLTQKYGLKLPRTWSCFPFLPYNSAVPSFIKGTYKTEAEHIDFSVLKDDKAIDSKKLSKFFYFLTEIIKLYKVFWEIERDFEKNFKKGEGLRNLSSFSALKTLTRFLTKEEPRLREFYGSYKSRLKNFKKGQDKILRELKAYNKPFRILLVLKKDETDY